MSDLNAEELNKRIESLAESRNQKIKRIAELTAKLEIESVMSRNKDRKIQDLSARLAQVEVDAAKQFAAGMERAAAYCESEGEHFGEWFAEQIRAAKEQTVTNEGEGK